MAAAREHQGGEAQRSPRMKPEHLTLATVLILLGGGGFGGVHLSAKLDEQAEASAKELKSELKAQAKDISGEMKVLGERLSGFQVSLSEIKGQLAASDKANDRTTQEQARLASELSELKDRETRTTTRLDELERRAAALEGRK